MSRCAAVLLLATPKPDEKNMSKEFERLYSAFHLKDQKVALSQSPLEIICCCKETAKKRKESHSLDLLCDLGAIIGTLAITLCDETDDIYIVEDMTGACSSIVKVTIIEAELHSNHL